MNSETKRLIAQWAARHGGKLYAPIPHPFLMGHPTRFTHAREELIEKYLVDAKEDETALDLGAHWGSFSFMLARHGYKVTAVEHNPLHAKILRAIALDIEDSVTVMEGDITEVCVKRQYDVVLAMGVAHFFARSQSKFYSFVNSIPKCREMYIQGWLEDEHAGEIKFRTMLDALKLKLGFNWSERMGEADNRPVYRIMHV